MESPNFNAQPTGPHFLSRHFLKTITMVGFLPPVLFSASFLSGCLRSLFPSRTAARGNFLERVSVEHLPVSLGSLLAPAELQEPQFQAGRKNDATEVQKNWGGGGAGSSRFFKVRHPKTRGRFLGIFWSFHSKPSKKGYPQHQADPSTPHFFRVFLGGRFPLVGILSSRHPDHDQPEPPSWSCQAVSSQALPMYINGFMFPEHDLYNMEVPGNMGAPGKFGFSCHGIPIICVTSDFQICFHWYRHS